MTSTTPEDLPQPEEIAALDEFDGDDLHQEQYIGEELAPDEDPNLAEHYDG